MTTIDQRTAKNRLRNMKRLQHVIDLLSRVYATNDIPDLDIRFIYDKAIKARNAIAKASESGPDDDDDPTDAEQAATEAATA